MLLRSLSSAPVTFLATSRYRASSICFVQLVSLLVPLLFSGAIALFLSAGNMKGIVATMAMIHNIAR